MYDVLSGSTTQSGVTLQIVVILFSLCTFFYLFISTDIAFFLLRNYIINFNYGYFVLIGVLPFSILL